MRVEMEAVPRRFEGVLLKFVIVDLVLTFFIAAVVVNSAVIMSGIIPFPDVLLLVPALSLLSALLAIGRFWGYLSTVVRCMGALEYVYDGFGGGKSSVSLEFQPPFLIVKSFLKQFAKPGPPTREFVFVLESDSQKYKTHCEVTAAAGSFALVARVEDWHGLRHERVLKGRLPALQKNVFVMVHDVRSEVLEARGVKVEAVPAGVEVYVPKPAVPVAAPVAQKPPVPAAPPVVVRPAEVGERVEELKAAVAEAPSEEKKALQDLLFEMEEIEKLVKEKKK